MCPNQNKNTDFSVKTPFPPKKPVNIQRPLCSTLQSQRTFKSPSGSIKLFCCRFMWPPFVQPRKTWRQWCQWPDRQNASYRKKWQHNLSPTLTHRQPRLHANSNTSNLLWLFCGKKQSICWVKRQHSDPIHWLVSQLLRKSWLQKPSSCQNSGKNSSTQTWASVLNRMRM